MKNKKKMCFGVIIGTRAYFNSELAKPKIRKQSQWQSQLQ